MADTARASAGSVTSRGLTLTSLFASRTTPAPLASMFCGQWRRIPCPDRMYRRLPSVPIHIVTRRGLPVFRPSVVSWTSRSRAAACSTSALNRLIRSLWRGERRDPPGVSDRVVHGATACREAVSLAIVAEPLPGDPVPLPISNSAATHAAHGGIPACCARGIGGDGGRREAVCDGRLRCRREQPAVGMGVRWHCVERGSTPADRSRPHVCRHHRRSRLRGRRPQLWSRLCPLFPPGWRVVDRACANAPCARWSCSGRGCGQALCDRR